MKRDLLNALVGEDLEHIPRGDLDQNTLRSVYNMSRRRYLARDPLAPQRRTLSAAVQQIRNNNPTFIPTYDSDYFARDEPAQVIGRD